MKKICIYHRGCVDGFLAAWLFDRYDGPYELVGCTYGEPMPDIPDGCYVVIVDFSFKREQLLALRERSAAVIVLDHHATAEVELKGLHFCVFDKSRCGASLAYMHLLPKIPSTEWYIVKDVVDYVEDRDLFRNVLPDTDAHTAYMGSLPHVKADWNRAIFNTTYVTRINEGRAVLRQKLRDVQMHVSRAELVDGIPTVNCTQTGIVSDVCAEMIRVFNTSLAICWADVGHGRRKYSVRGHGARQYCEQRGGGGHDLAAGYEQSST